jgi:hypothetical protein
VAAFQKLWQLWQHDRRKHTFSAWHAACGGMYYMTV